MLRICLAFIACLALGPLANAAPKAPPAADQGVKFYVANFPPYAFLGPTGPSGFFVDLIKAMAEHTSNKGSLDVVPWKRAQHELLQLQDKAPKLIFPLIRSPERESQYRWVAELYTDDIVLILRKGEARKIARLSDAKGMRIGVVGGSALLAELQADGNQIIDMAPDIDSCAKKLQYGRIDAWYVTRWVGLSTLKHIGADLTQIKVSPVFHRMSIFLGASPDTSDGIVAEWAKAFEIVKGNGIYRKILAKWTKETSAELN